MADLFESFLKFIEEKKLIRAGDCLLVAVSGGVDSVVLLDLFYRAAPELKICMEVIHLNHGIRGKEADEDEKFVAALANKLNLPFHVKKVSVPKFADENSLSLEDAARKLRYQFFSEIAEQVNADKIALAHHADDQVETVILHFLRGSGLSGLSGMAVQRDIYIRPLLFARRADIENYAHEKNLKFRQDSSNENINFRRNRIRHELLPYLMNYFNPGISRAILRTQRIMAEVDEYFQHEAAQAFAECLKQDKKNKITLEIEVFLSYFNIIQKYIVYHVLQKFGIDRFTISAEKLEQIIHLIQQRKFSKKIILKKNVWIQIDRSEIVFQKGDEEEFEIYVEPGNIYKLPGSDEQLRLTLEKVFTPKIDYSENPNIEIADWEKIKGSLRIRSLRHGDKFVPLNFKGHKKVSDFLTDLKVPLHRRRELVILECDVGIVWIVGFRLDDRFKVTPETTHVLKMEKIAKTA